jgi:formylglycine-generating enzyme required for sulfatase activity
VVLAPDDFDVTLVALEAGDVLSGRYRLVRKLGRGGMGVVWLADDMVLDEQVALKLLPTPLARDARSVARMKDEAKRNLRLTHPHIVRLMNFERDDARGGMAFLIMQYVKGQTLNDVLAKLPEGVPLKHVRKWAVQLASALDYAHEQGVLHRDIKPSNVMIDRQGNASLMDFGIAREAKDTMTHVTGRDSSGTLPYMSPQQVAGLNHPSNDIYALAATLYEALCGNPPFHTGDIVDQIKHRTPPPLADQPPCVNDALLDALAKRREERPPTAFELANRLEHGGPSRRQTMEQRPRRRRTIPLVVAVLLLYVGAFGWIGWQRGWWSSTLGSPKASVVNATDMPPALALVLGQVSELRSECAELDTGVHTAISESIASADHALEHASQLMKADDWTTAERRLGVAREACQTAISLERLAIEAREAATRVTSGANAVTDWVDHPHITKLREQVEDDCREATSQFRTGRFTDARDLWGAALGKLDEAVALNRSALGARDADEVHRQKRDAIERAALSPQLCSDYDRAIDQSGRAEADFKRGDFASARTTWIEAERLLISVQELHRIAVEGAASARTEWEQLRDERLEPPLEAAVRDERQRIAELDVAAQDCFQECDYTKAKEKWEKCSQELARVTQERRAAMEKTRVSMNEWQAHLENEITTRWYSDPEISQRRVGANRAAELAQERFDAGDFEAALESSRDAIGALREALAIQDDRLTTIWQNAIDESLAVADRTNALSEYLDYRPDNQRALVLRSELMAMSRPTYGHTKTIDLGYGAAMDLVYIKAGTFTMGSPKNEDGRDNDEEAHAVRITRDFWMSRTEVTKRQWRAFERSAEFERQNGGREESGVLAREPDDAEPKTAVVWAQTTQFSDWIARRLNQTVRLPTEAEWEYACRAGSQTSYNSGETLDPRQAVFNVGFLPASERPSDRRADVMPVASFEANDWGLFDMHGNVAEWCLDFYDKDFYERRLSRDGTAVEDPVNDGSQGYVYVKDLLRVTRGGSWRDGPVACRSASRDNARPDDALPTIGFRIVVEVDPVTSTAPDAAAMENPPAP